MRTPTKQELETMLEKIEEQGFDYWLQNEAENDLKGTIVEEDVKLLNKLSDTLWSALHDTYEKSSKEIIN